MSESDRRADGPVEIPDDLFDRRPMEVASKGSDRRVVLTLAAVAGAVLVLLVSMGAFGLYVYQQSRKRALSAPQRTPGDVRAAFTEKATDGDPDLPRIKALFDSIGRDFRNKNYSAVAPRFDLDRTLQSVDFSGFSSVKADEIRPMFLKGMQQGLEQQMAQFRALDYERFEVRLCRFSTDRQEALVYVRQWNDVGATYRIAWWLRRSGARWRIFDFEEIGLGLRWTATCQVMIDRLKHGQLGVREMDALRADLQRLPTAAMMLQEGDSERALQELNGITRDDLFPSAHRALRWILAAKAHNHRQQFADALDACDHADRSLVVGYTALQRATACQWLGKSAEALQHAERYLQEVGNDAEGFLVVGLARRSLGQHEAALQAFRQGLDDDPDSYDLLYELGIDLPSGRTNEITERFAKSQRRAEQLNWHCASFRNAGRLDLVQAVLDQYAVRDATYFFHLAALRNSRQELGPAWEAVCDAQKLLNDETPDDTRKEIGELYLRVAALSGHALQAYAAQQPTAQSAAFRSLADALSQRLYQRGNRRELQTLIERHRHSHAEDIWLACFDAMLREKDEDLAAVAELLKPHLEKMQPDEEFDEHLDRYWSACAKLGRAAAAYAEHPGVDGFRRAATSLGYSLPWQPAMKSLEELLDAHRRQFPKDPNLTLFGAKLLAARGDRKQAAERFAELLRRPDKDSFAYDPAYDYYFTMYLLGQSLEAYRAALDPDDAFETLTWMLESSPRPRNRAILKQLREEHRRKNPGSVQADFLEIESLLEQKDYPRALQLCRDVEPRISSDDDRRTLRWHQNRAIVDSGDVPADVLAGPDAKDRFLGLIRWVAYSLSEEKHRKTFDRLIELRRQQEPNDPAIEYFLASREINDGEFAKAEARLKPFVQEDRLATETDDPSIDPRELYRSARIKQWQLAAIVEESPDKPAAFREVMRAIAPTDLEHDEHRQAVRKLLSASQSWKPPPAFSLQGYEAGLRAAAGDLDGALDALRKRPGDEPYEYSAWSFEQYARRKLLEAGRLADLFEVEGSTVDGFRELTSFLSDEDSKSADELAKAIDLHARRFSDDPSLPLYRAQLASRRGDHAAAAEILWSVKDRIEQLRGPDWDQRYEANDLLVESLLRSGRLDDAAEHVAATESLASNVWDRLRIALARKDVASACYLADEYLTDEDNSVELIYEDEFLMTLLEQPDLQAFREEFPKPAE